MLLSGYRFVDIFFMEEVEVLFSVFFFIKLQICETTREGGVRESCLLPVRFSSQFIGVFIISTAYYSFEFFILIICLNFWSSNYRFVERFFTEEVWPTGEMLNC